MRRAASVPSCWTPSARPTKRSGDWGGPSAPRTPTHGSRSIGFRPTSGTPRAWSSSRSSAPWRSKPAAKVMRAAFRPLRARSHDVGELLLDWEHMREPRELIPAERRSLRRHPTIGERLLPTVGLEREACRIVGAHHERLDGSGYPDRLSGANVPMGAQVLAVAEAYEAMTHRRPYRRAIEPVEAIARLRREAAAGRLNIRAVDALADVKGEL
ncbi:MAG: HD domain-containing protein [Actinobacteria bacterium]|nr:MAG: HD domain-containing protein [Actinomycetota bacterium]